MILQNYNIPPSPSAVWQTKLAYGNFLLTHKFEDFYSYFLKCKEFPARGDKLKQNIFVMIFRILKIVKEVTTSPQQASF